jgi:hypothetical protein
MELQTNIDENRRTIKKLKAKRNLLDMLNKFFFCGTAVYCICITQTTVPFVTNFILYICMRCVSCN